MSDEFQSTHPLRGATQATPRCPTLTPISIHAPLAGCDAYTDSLVRPFDAISIHAPLAGCDWSTRSGRSRRRNFNPRTPCGVRRVRINRDDVDAIFQSTHPLRGATGFLPDTQSRATISIHAPLAGCDTSGSYDFYLVYHFNPRTPCGVRRTVPVAALDLNRFQSTHPLRGATGAARSSRSCAGYFNPRTPCGVRPFSAATVSPPSAFQSTHPLRGATSTLTVRRTHTRFQSTHPLRGATSWRRRWGNFRRISIHAPLAGCDAAACTAGQSACISIHAPLAGCDHPTVAGWAWSRAISIHAPLAGCDLMAGSITNDLTISIHAPLAGCDCLRRG